MKQPNIIAIIGARPQFIKHYPFEMACVGKLNLKTIHTGQHYDANMSQVFFDQLEMRKPDFILKLGGGKHGEQTAGMISEIEKIIENEKPDGIVVYGDTNSTLAGAIVASKLHIPIFHIEAGLRSYNKEMPEEVNRVLTDHVSSLLFTPSQIANENLKKEGITSGVHDVGDIMKDLVQIVEGKNIIGEKSLNEDYYYVTIHRPYNTDDSIRLKSVLDNLNKLDKKVLMAIHPRTLNLMNSYGFSTNSFLNIEFIEPQSYFSNLSYLTHSNGLITDSGGMQKEAYWLEKKCVTIRKETEWVETVTLKGNTLIFDNLTGITELINEKPKQWDKSLYGNGTAAIQIVDLILNHFRRSDD